MHTEPPVAEQTRCVRARPWLRYVLLVAGFYFVHRTLYEMHVYVHAHAADQHFGT